jgi:hypothetical protein
MRELTFGMKFQHEVVSTVEGKEVKKMVDDEKRTEVKFNADFSKLELEQVIDYASKEFMRIVNNEIRDGKRTLESVQGKTLEVPVLVVGERGKAKVTVENAKNKIVETYGISLEQFEKIMAQVKANAPK